MALNDIYQVTVFQTLHGQTILNTCHYRESVSSGAGGQAQLASVIDNAIATAWKPVLNTEWAYDYTQVQKIYPGIKTYPTINGTGAGAGTNATGESMPTSVAVTFTKYTSLAGQRYRGRFYLTGFSEAYVNLSKLTSSGISDIAPLGGALCGIKASFGYTFQPVIWHKDNNTYTDVNGVVLHAPMRSQRRRQLFRGI